MKIKKLIMILGCAALLSGCTKSNIVSPTGVAAEPDTQVHADIVLDWNQVYEEVRETMMDPYTYPDIMDVVAEQAEDGTTVKITVTTDQGVDTDGLLTFCTDAIKATGDEIATQDFNFTGSDDDTYGSYFDTHAVKVEVQPYYTKDDDSTWLVNQTIEAGTNAEVELTDAGLEAAEEAAAAAETAAQ